MPLSLYRFLFGVLLAITAMLAIGPPLAGLEILGLALSGWAAIQLYQSFRGE